MTNGWPTPCLGLSPRPYHPRPVCHPHKLYCQQAQSRRDDDKQDEDKPYTADHRTSPALQPMELQPHHCRQGRMLLSAGIFLKRGCPTVQPLTAVGRPLLQGPKAVSTLTLSGHLPPSDLVKSLRTRRKPGTGSPPPVFYPVRLPECLPLLHQGIQQP